MSVLLFDLDGTLIDSEIGITRCLSYAFERLGVAPPPREQLQRWIGPPLRTSFGSALDNAQQVEAAVEFYRERFDREGWAEHRVYEGIGSAIGQLAADGHRLAVVTSKNESHARRIVESFAFAGHFEIIVGASADGRIGEKPELIALALERLGVAAEQCWMIGDRHFDVRGAKSHAMRAAGVLWGFGASDELREAGADLLLEHPDHLRAAFS